MTGAGPKRAARDFKGSCERTVGIFFQAVFGVETRDAGRAAARVTALLQADDVGADRRHRALCDTDLAGHAHEVRALDGAFFTRGEALAEGALDHRGVAVVAGEIKGGLAAVAGDAGNDGLGELAEIEAVRGGEAVEIRLAGEEAYPGDEPGDRGDLARAHQEQPAEVGEREEVGEGLDGEGFEGRSPSLSGALGLAPHAAADSAARTPPRNNRREQPGGFTSLDGDAKEAAVLGADAEQVLLSFEEASLLVLHHLAVDVDGAALDEAHALRA